MLVLSGNGNQKLDRLWYRLQRALEQRADSGLSQVELDKAGLIAVEQFVSAIEQSPRCTSYTIALPFTV